MCNSVDQPNISILISSWNEAKWVASCFDCILAQSHRNFEVLIADDASTDSTAEAIKAQKDPRIKFVRHKPPRLGLVATVNELAQMARGRLLKLLCLDDLMKPDCLARGWELYQQHPDLSFICVRWDMIDDSSVCWKKNDSLERRSWLETSIEFKRLLFLNDASASLSALFVPKARFIDAGGLRDLSKGNVGQPPTVEDIELTMRLSSLGPVVRTLEPQVSLRVHRQQASRSRSVLASKWENAFEMLQDVSQELLDAGEISQGAFEARWSELYAGQLVTAAKCIVFREFSSARRFVRLVPAGSVGAAVGKAFVRNVLDNARSRRHWGLVD